MDWYRHNGYYDLSRGSGTANGDCDGCFLDFLERAARMGISLWTVAFERTFGGTVILIACILGAMPDLLAEDDKRGLAENE